MDEIQEKKRQIRDDISKILKELSENDIKKKTKQIHDRLFEFANFMEAKIPLLYVSSGSEVSTWDVIKRAYRYNKVIVIPLFGKEKYNVKMMKIDNPDTDLIPGTRDILEPNPEKCQAVPMNCIEIALIPSIALDEKGGRIGSGDGYYDRLIPKLPITARKVSLAMEYQIIQQVPMTSHDKYVDIIITEERIIYKI